MPRPKGTSTRCGQCQNCTGKWRQRCLNPRKDHSTNDEKITANCDVILDSGVKRVEKVESLSSVSTIQKGFRTKLRHPKNNNPLGYYSRLLSKPKVSGKSGTDNSDTHYSSQLDISVLCKELGIGKDIPAKYSRKLKFIKSIEEMSKSRLSELLTTVERLVEDIIKILHPTQVQQILGCLAGRWFKDLNNKTDLMNSRIVSEVATSYKHCDNKKEKERLLSVLVANFTRAELSKILGSEVKERTFKNARMHRACWGAGANGMKLPYRVLKFSEEDIKKLLIWIQNPENIQNIAVGEKRVISSEGEEYHFSNLQRKFPLEVLWKKYQKHLKEKREDMKWSQSTFEAVVKTITGSEQKKVAACDIINVRYGYENFQEIRKLLLEIQEKLPALKNHPKTDKIQRDIEWTEKFIKVDLKSHLKSESVCAAHCVQHALSSRKDDATFTPCKHKHNKRCKDCDSMHLLFVNLNSLLDLAVADIPLINLRETNKMIDSFRERIDVHYKFMLHYIAHCVRTFHEGQVRYKVAEALKENEIMVTADWKMKQLATKFRETQSDWFGKAGTIWHGVMVVRKVWNAEKSEFEYHATFETLVSDDKKEDGFAVLSSLRETFLNVKRDYPQITKATLLTDGAGCYSGTYLAINVAKLGEWTGVYVDNFFNSESGDGKSVLDSIFGVQKDNF